MRKVMTTSLDKLQTLAFLITPEPIQKSLQSHE